MRNKFATLIGPTSVKTFVGGVVGSGASVGVFEIVGGGVAGVVDGAFDGFGVGGLVTLNVGF